MEDRTAMRVGPLTQTDIVRYAGASGDFHRLHHDTAFAQSAGFPGPFAMGMFSAGLMAAAAMKIVDPADVRRFRTRFHGQIWIGDTLEVAGERNGSELTLRCTNQHGEVVSRAWLETEP